MSNTVAPYSRNENTTDVWLTPPELVRALGEFMLDPCAPPDAPWYHAPIYYTEAIDGLKMPWFGRVWCNPPYGKETGRWMRRLAEHGDGTALIFARVETKWFHETVWQKADAVLFFDKRISFYKVDGTRGTGSSAPSCLVAYGEQNVQALERSKLGFVVRLTR